MSASALASAYAHCESVTRTRAANFYYGIRLLPRERRRAMCAAYAFARRVDDIGDGQLAHEQKLRELEAQALALAALGGTRAAAAGTGLDGAAAGVLGAALAAGGAEDPVLLALADAQARFAIPLEALGALIDGVRMDVEGISYECFDELVLYCRRVAGAIGRVCLAIFGLREGAGAGAERAGALADDLGVALQLTNILRDVREDAENGRVYLPYEDLRRFGLVEAGASGERALQQARTALLAGGGRAGEGGGGDGGGDAGGQLAALIGFEAERAREWFARGMALVPLLDRRSAACVLAMAGIYRRLLERIAASPEEAVRRRMSLSGPEKAWVAARGMLAGGAA